MSLSNMSRSGSPPSSSSSSSSSSVFTVESRSRGAKVLERLDAQRRSDLLTDVTVAAGGRSFRAHRAVLATCSEYFSHAVSKYARHGAVLSLPPEVTAAGFEPLLKFAYTSKLLFSKHDILEIRSAASILGFRDLDPTCFDFLLPKLFSGGRSSAPFHRNMCCKKTCKKGPSREDECLEKDTSENEAKPVSDWSSNQEVGQLDGQQGIDPMGMKNHPETQTSGTHTQPKETNHYYQQCPKYRKFQLACCSNRSPDPQDGAPLLLSPHSSQDSEDLRESMVENPVATGAAHRTGSRESTDSSEDVEQGRGDGVRARGDHGDGQEGERQARPAVGSEVAVVARPSGSSALLTDSSVDGADRSEAAPTPGRTSPGFTLRPPPPGRALSEDGASEGPPGPLVQTSLTETQEDRQALPLSGRLDERPAGGEGARPVKRETDLCWMRRGGSGRSPGGGGEAPGGGGGGERSSGEMDVARRLAELPGLPSSPPPGTDHRPWAGDGSGWTGCPFLQDLAPPGGRCPVAEGRGAVSPSVSPPQSTEEADSETETEADDASALEKARQVRLPFSVDWVVNLSKSDFQQLLKRRTLNLEQQEFVHDMRRRSKNRMAAQRCRKRKLDCIHNLECEINKLRTEKQRMMVEHSQLQQLKTRSWRSVSALCDKICSEASLMPEQLQVLAKYTTSDCPFASLIPRMDIALSGPVATPQAQALSETCSSDPGVDEACAQRSSYHSGDVFGGTERPLEDATGP